MPRHWNGGGCYVGLKSEEFESSRRVLTGWEKKYPGDLGRLGCYRGMGPAAAGAQPEPRSLQKGQTLVRCCQTGVSLQRNATNSALIEFSCTKLDSKNFI